MEIKTYGVFDGCAKEIVRTFVSKNDEVAERAAKYIVREPNFDEISGKDYVILYLYTMDSGTGVITDNSIHTICSLATAIDEYKLELKEKEKETKNVKSIKHSSPSQA